MMCSVSCILPSISIHALREEGDLRHRGKAAFCGISIHALREEGDQPDAAHGRAPKISIHALREEGDGRCFAKAYSARLFLSTPSARRATLPLRERHGQDEISIHALREEGDPAAITLAQFIIISIHALREEGDPAFWCRLRSALEFLSTPSARRATPFRMMA